MSAGFGEVVERLRRSTVQIRAGRNSGGSGVVWDKRGAIVTNAHVAHSNSLSVQLWDGRTFEARTEKRDPRRDLALVRIEAGEAEPASPGDSRGVRVGEVVLAVGNPFGFTGALSTGVVHGLGPIRGLGTQEYIQAAVRLAPGNSGGPLALASGKVIGINTMVVAGGLALAVPAVSVERFLAQRPPTGLGVTVRPVRIQGPSPGIGWIVLSVTPGSPAERSSVQLGDVLVGSGERAFHSFDDLAAVLDDANGGVVKLRFLRGGQPREREVAVCLVEGVAA